MNHHPRYLPTILTTLALLTVALDAGAQSSGPPASDGGENGESECEKATRECEEEAEELANQLAAVEGDVRERDGTIAQLVIDKKANAAIIASLNVKLEDRGVALRSRPSVPGVVGRTLATSCIVGLVVAGARYTLTQTVDVLLIVMSGAQCVGAGVALGWGE